MALVIQSAGNFVGSRVRTVTTRGAFVLLGLAGLTVLGAGVAGGLVVGARLAGPDGSPAAPVVDPARPVNQALIDRVGTLSARLLRLESEAQQLGRRVGIPAKPATTLAPVPPAPAGANSTDPSGGPLLAPFPDIVGPGAGIAELAAGLARLEAAIDVIDATMELVARRTSASDLADMAYPNRLPIPHGRISSGFGNRRDPFTQRLARHTGVDLPAPVGTPILASAGGTVRFAGRRSAYGSVVEIDHGGGLVTRYAHASRLLVRRGQVVLPEQPVALVGSTGRSTGPHLHFEVLRDGVAVEPRRYLVQP